MSGYLPTIEYRTTFEDDAISVNMAPLSRQSYVVLAPKLAATNEDDPKAQADIYEAAVSILANHITSITGLRDANGSAVTKEQILDAVYFAPLVTDLFQHLIASASLGKGQPATSEDRLPASTEAQDSPQVSSVDST
jgi:hypothetical protein